MGLLDYERVHDRKTLWDVKEVHVETHSQTDSECKIIGPKRKSMYTIKNSKIVRLEPVSDDITSGQKDYKAVDIVIPVNRAEKLLLEGTKMSLDDIKTNKKFKNYESGVPSRILYLKNIAPSVSKERLILLFDKFLDENQGPINVRLMVGRMRGQAFIEFRDEHIAVKALQDVNGTIIDGKPIIVQFGRNSK
ncbi:RNA-binding protein 41 [Eumeta japonica]|uniref:RNA-binding protein 41 n=1 Tax=Eumeta variegata TaxID=151549 RepID=A0A4C1TUZ5_EUMVA|nr:RNA-binding protein 41 [Eumeta japonica]